MEPNNEVLPVAAVPTPGAGEVVPPVDPATNSTDAPAAGLAQDDAANVAPEVAGTEAAVGEGEREEGGVTTTLLVGGDGKPHRQYPSLYDSTLTTIVAIIFGISIIAGIQVFVSRIFRGARDEYAALTHFVVSMVALVIGAYLVDLIISGPDTSLLTGAEKATILDFIKHTCGLVFGYYFGSRSRTTTTVPADTTPE